MTLEPQLYGIAYVTLIFTLQQQVQEAKPQFRQQVAQNPQNLVSEYQVPYFLPLLPAQNQSKKVKSAPNPVT